MTLHTRATPKSLAAPALQNTSPTYSEGIQGWDLWWLELLEALDASLPPATNASSSSNHHKSQPCIPFEYVGMVFWRAGAAGHFGVALVSIIASLATTIALVPNARGSRQSHAIDGSFSFASFHLYFLALASPTTY